MISVFVHTFHVWTRLVINSFRTQMATSLGSAGYLIGKLLRFFLFLIYLLAIFKTLPGLKGYGMAEVVLFFMTFNLVDVMSQFLFRGLYGMKYYIEEGDFDKIITQPFHPLFRLSNMSVDLLDLLTLIPIVGVTLWTFQKLDSPVTLINFGLYVILIINALMISYSIHVLVASLSVRTHEMESAIWVYRDVMTLGRFPVAIYSDVVRGLLVTLVPIGIMVSFPARVVLGLLSWKGIFYALLINVFFHLFSQWFWNQSLKRYTSISS